MNNSKAVQQAFFSIARCKNIPDCFADASHPCAAIVRSQNAADIASFQLPEPWVGEIDVAPILFVASNPSIGEDEHSTGSAGDEDVWESHHLAFGGGKRNYIDDGIHTTRADGSIIKPVRYWASVRARARELIPNRPVVPGRDYAMTEVVHCKSKNEVGVLTAVESCVNLHLESVMSVSAAVIVVAMGVFAQRWVLGSKLTTSHMSERVLGGKTRLVVSMPHPNARSRPKTFANNLTSDEMEHLTRAVAVATHS
jgi:uracil-DNA glycosylase